MKRIRPARHYQHPRAPIRRIADEAILPIARAMKPVLQQARRALDGERAAYLIANGRWREVYGLVDWGHHEEAMRRPMALIGDVWLAGGEVGERKINGAFANRGRKVRFRPSLLRKDIADQFNFDRFDPATQRKIRAFQDALITNLGADARAVIEQTILRGLRMGWDPNDIVRELRLVIGLTSRQSAAVLRYRDQLRTMDPDGLKRSLTSTAAKAALQSAIASGLALQEATIDALTQQYEQAYLDYRAKMIATTEATRAASLGLQDSYAQAVERGAMPAEAVRQVWQISLDERTCDHCLSVVDLNPDGVPLGEMFQTDEGPVDGPGLHPNCRCSLEMVTDLDLVPADYDG